MEWGVVFNGDRVSIEEDEKFRRWMIEICNHVSVLSAPEL